MVDLSSRVTISLCLMTVKASAVSREELIIYCFFAQAIVSVQVIDNLLFDSLKKLAGDTEEADVAILQRG